MPRVMKNTWNLDMQSSREFFVKALRRPLIQFETGTPLGRAKKTWSKMGTAAVVYIALLASRLPWFLGGAAPAPAGAGYIYFFFHTTLKWNIPHIRSYTIYSAEI